MSKKDKKPVDKSSPKCPFCGRCNTVKYVEDTLYHCEHCLQMFDASSL